MLPKRSGDTRDATIRKLEGVFPRKGAVRLENENPDGSALYSCFYPAFETLKVRAMRWAELRDGVRQHRHNLASDIDVGIIVTSKFRGSDSGPNEDDLPSYRHRLPMNVSGCDEIRAVNESLLLAPTTEDQRGFSTDSLSVPQRDGLEKA